MKYVAALVLFSIGFGCMADCKPFVDLHDSVSIPFCDPKKDDCRDAAETLRGYMENVPDDKTLVTVALQTSPWRFYDAEMRILTMDEMVEIVRPHLKAGTGRVQLIGSWTAVRRKRMSVH